MENIKDFIDFHAENNGMTREEYTAYYLSEKKATKLIKLSLVYNDRGGRLYKATFNYSNGEEFKFRSSDIEEIEGRIETVFGLKVEAGNIRDIDKHENELFKLSKKLGVDLTIYEHDLS
jgi:pimeloyl-CoA synthetase